jgi:diadenosine tetraphosphatase ApaH/serine/threonine PP2A family protein phosphatase
MRYFIFSDVHANLEAFEAVLSAVAQEPIDRGVFLGDIVGYGAHPNQAVEQLRQMDTDLVLRGNHDKVVAGVEDGSDFNLEARSSAMWARGQIQPDNRDYLRRMPKGPIPLDGIIEASHGSPNDEDYYILSDLDANQILRRSEIWITLFGHTHVPIIYSTKSWFVGTVYPDADDFCYSLSKNVRYLINPGSVGQPRDWNPKASFAILDTAEQTLRIKRVAYDIRAAQRSIRAAGLPEWHAERLAIGR